MPLKLGSDKLTVFVLLCGSDFSSTTTVAGGGVKQLGQKKTAAFVASCSESHVLPWLMDWLDTPATADAAAEHSDTICGVCKHGGNKRRHSTQGCLQCGNQAGSPCVPPTRQTVIQSKTRKRLNESLAGVSKQELRRYWTEVTNAYSCSLPDTPISPADHWQQQTTPNVLQNSSWPNWHRLSDLNQRHLCYGMSSGDFVGTVCRKLVCRLLVRAGSAPAGAAAVGAAQACGLCSSPQRVCSQRKRHGLAEVEVEWCTDGQSFKTMESRKLMQSGWPELLLAFEQSDEVRKLKEKSDKKLVPGQQKLVNMFKASKTPSTKKPKRSDELVQNVFAPAVPQTPEKGATVHQIPQTLSKHASRSKRPREKRPDIRGFFNKKSKSCPKTNSVPDVIVIE